MTERSARSTTPSGEPLQFAFSRQIASLIVTPSKYWLNSEKSDRSTRPSVDPFTLPVVPVQSLAQVAFRSTFESGDQFGFSSAVFIATK